MDYKQIEDLLERYWEGDTTLEEERQLRQYFQAGPTDARFRAIAPLFQTLSSEQLITAPAHLGQNMANPHIAALLERYFEGDTTLTEERELKQYFDAGQIDAQFKAVAPLFQALSAAQLETAPKHIAPSARPAVAPLRVAMSSRTWYRAAAAAVLVGLIATAVWRMSETVAPTGSVVQTNIPMVPEAQVTVPQTASTITEEAVVQTAAPKATTTKARRRPIQQQAVPAPLSVPEAHEAVVAQQEPEYTEEDAQKALEELKAALALVSSKINKGTKDASKPFSKVNVDQYF